MTAFTFGTFKQIKEPEVQQKQKANSVAETILDENFDPFEDNQTLRKTQLTNEHDSIKGNFSNLKSSINNQLKEIPDNVARQASSALNGVNALVNLQNTRVVKNPLKTMEQLEFELSATQIENEKLKMELQLLKAEVSLIRDLTNQILK